MQPGHLISAPEDLAFLPRLEVSRFKVLPLLGFADFILTPGLHNVLQSSRPSFIYHVLLISINNGSSSKFFRFEKGNFITTTNTTIITTDGRNNRRATAQTGDHRCGW